MAEGIHVKGRHRRSYHPPGINQVEKMSMELLKANHLLDEGNRQLGEANRMLDERNRQLGTANRMLDERNRQLAAVNRMLDQGNHQLETANRMLDERNRQLAEANQLLDERNRQLGTANRMLDERNRQLAASEYAQKQMISNVSHDLRAPITAIHSAVDRLAEGTTRGERDRLIPVLERRVRVLETMVETLHYAMTLDRPEFSLALRRLDLIPLLEEYHISQALVLAGRRFCLELNRNKPLWAAVDAHHFIRVLDNLLSNALHYTEEGDRVLLSCRETAGWAEIRVSDTGSGIDPAAMPYIFQRSYRASSARTPGETGAGFGLFIAKTLMEKHGGRIRCESKLGVGSSFILLLPLLEDA